MVIPTNSSRTRHPVGHAILHSLAVLGVIAALSGCSAPSTSKDSDADRTESFDFNGRELTVDNDYADVDVDHGEPGTVTVREYRTVIGTSAEKPEWRLKDERLDLGRPCASTIGICQISYRITVPESTAVTPMRTVEGAS